MLCSMHPLKNRRRPSGRGKIGQWKVAGVWQWHIFLFIFLYNHFYNTYFEVICTIKLWKQQIQGFGLNSFSILTCLCSDDFSAHSDIYFRTMWGFRKFSDIFQVVRSRYNVILIVIFIVLINQIFQTDSINVSNVKSFGFEPYPRVKSISHTPYSYHKLKSKVKVATHGITRIPGTQVIFKYLNSVKSMQILTFGSLSL